MCIAIPGRRGLRSPLARFNPAHGKTRSSLYFYAAGAQEVLAYGLGVLGMGEHKA